MAPISRREGPIASPKFMEREEEGERTRNGAFSSISGTLRAEERCQTTPNSLLGESRPKAAAKKIDVIGGGGEPERRNLFGGCSKGRRKSEGVK